jgi:hypothetical protein
VLEMEDPITVDYDLIEKLFCKKIKESSPKQEDTSAKKSKEVSQYSVHCT